MAEAVTVSGTERAAILLMSLGEQTAAAVLRHMDVDEVQRVGSAMAALEDVPRDKVTHVLGELLIAVGNKTQISIGTDEYVRKVLTESLSERETKWPVGPPHAERDSKAI